ncbi:MAG: 50S ribosomal protein L22 [Candidatus Pacebacteria bacterium]|nr:50S ribosomal protein L22 [Candidatus Paceibacterota bacterium]
MEKEYTAKLSYLRMAPRKVRSVGDLIKGLPANEAEAQLLMQTRRPSKPLLKLLRSAVANAKNNGLAELHHLYVVNVRVDGGPMLKRMLPRARGSASPIQKKMSHVTLVLGVNEKLKSRFTIVPPKKKKPAPTEDPKTRTAKKRSVKPEQEGGEPNKKDGKNNFWKRTFSRKAGMGE